MNRPLYALAMIAAALLPLSASSSPSPSPSLPSLLTVPPTGFTELTPAELHGRFTAHDYAATYHSKAADAENALRRDGFVDGYGMTWVQQSAGHFLLEFVIAFEGGSGARNWLVYERASDENDPNYQNSDSIAGIDPYYGVHLASSSTHVVADAFSFVKGNDVFGVGFVSTQDDVLNLATTQAKSQYDSAPNETIPHAQWPENSNSSPSAAYDLGRVVGDVLILALIVGVVGLVVGVIRRSRRPPALPIVSAPTAFQMSPDGNYWWDGQRWIDSSYEPPPFAQRTDDGANWWDGWNWRPVPRTVQPPTSGR